jgi:MFS family permease
LGTLINKAGGFVVPFLALYITGRGGSEGEAGVVMALYGGGAILAGITGGFMADRVGRKTTMLVSFFGGAMAMLAISVSRSLSEICATTFFMGWLAELYRPAVSACTADLVPPLDRPRAYAHLYWANNLGFAIAPILGGLIASKSFTALFVGDAVTLAAYGVLVLLRVPETRPEALQSFGRWPSTWCAPQSRGAVVDWTFLGFVLLMLGLTLVMWQDRSSLPLDLRRHGIDQATYGSIMCVNGVMIVLFQPSVTWALSTWSRTSVLAWASFLFGVGYGLYGVVSSVPGYLFAIIIWTVGEMAVVPTAAAVVADLAPVTLRGRYQGLYSMSFGVASCIGPLLGVAVLQRMGGQALWFCCFALMLLVSLGQLALGRARTVREATAHNTGHA